MIWFDVTKSGPSGHRSGLSRVSSRLREELGVSARPVSWNEWDRGALAGDWFCTAELFSEAERPGLWNFLRNPPCRLAAIYHDAIPLRHPQITWPQSVSRHPEYMKMLGRFERVFAVSAASRDELLGFWRWQGVTPRGEVEVLPLGADFNAAPRVSGRGLPERPLLLSVGIIEPRKNQLFLLERCTELWAEGVRFELHLVGRLNPHFGPPILARLKALQQKHPGLAYHAAASDAAVADLYRRARASVFPTIAEGCGLPLLESLWMGVPCLCSDLPVLRENSDGGGCLTAPANDADAWRNLLRRALTDDMAMSRLTAEAQSRSLPRWSAAADLLLRRLGS